MKWKNYLPLWTLLAAAFAAVVAVSVHSPVSLFGYELKDSGIVAAFSKTADEGKLPAAPEIHAGAMLNDSVLPQDSARMVVPVDTASKTILFIGDSMLDGLYPRLAAYARHNGHKLYAVIWYSSTSEIWGKSGKLKSYIQRLNPDYLFICLGANELFVKDIAAKRDKHVKTIVSEIGDIPYVWIGPPNWKPDTGINELISANTAPGAFFMSNGMTFSRGKDGAHPTRESAAQWMDSVVRWMATDCAHPIRLEIPAKKSDKAHRVFVHQPGEQ